MTADTAIGQDDPLEEQGSGIDDDQRAREARKAREDGQVAPAGGTGHDLTREDIQSGNDRNTSADQNNRSGKTNKLHDDGIELGR